MCARGWISSARAGFVLLCGYFSILCGVTVMMMVMMMMVHQAAAGCRDRESPNCCTGRNNDCFEHTGRKTTCYCDTYCQRTGDCCEDYQSVCQISGAEKRKKKKVEEEKKCHDKGALLKYFGGTESAQSQSTSSGSTVSDESGPSPSSTVLSHTPPPSVPTVPSMSETTADLSTTSTTTSPSHHGPSSAPPVDPAEWPSFLSDSDRTEQQPLTVWWAHGVSGPHARLHAGWAAPKEAAKCPSLLETEAPPARTSNSAEGASETTKYAAQRKRWQRSFQIPSRGTLRTLGGGLTC
ncbi:uncharacterized protein [Nerophis lumbriciformis]|uniref:uncharacterized protein isoform X1 n=1 Tax=Nerophis lumbriciformis TaxID=546530 RepID=UPI002AE07CBE|nr:proteoglycan 4-like isoform X1 [Nerophis lumbriciformis]XP_061784629.1 proteoglycan 4-like isoform X1 [Nerophis lumbriciformis]